jgi:hypothetical protein
MKYYFDGILRRIYKPSKNGNIKDIQKFKTAIAHGCEKTIFNLGVKN